MNYKKNRYGLHSIEKTEINALQLEEIPDSVISYKDKYAKISKDVCKDKYSFYKYMRQEDTILFRHERAEIYLKYDSCQEIWFLKEIYIIQTISQQCLAYIVYPNQDHFNIIISTIWSSSTSITNTKEYIITLLLLFWLITTQIFTTVEKWILNRSFRT